jgi:hypothetical protein
VQPARLCGHVTFRGAAAGLILLRASAYTGAVRVSLGRAANLNRSRPVVQTFTMIAVLAAAAPSRAADYTFRDGDREVLAEGVFELAPIRRGGTGAVAVVVTLSDPSQCLALDRPGEYQLEVGDGLYGPPWYEERKGERRLVAVTITADEDSSTGQRVVRNPLETLSDDEIRNLRGVRVEHWSAEVARSLRRLDLRRTCITLGDALTSFPALPAGIELLVVEHPIFPREPSLRAGRLPALRYLRVESLSDDAWALDLAELEAPRLEHLTVRAPVVNAERLRHFPVLRELSLGRGAERVDFVHGTPALQRLEVTGVKDLRPLGRLRALREIHADASAVQRLPLVEMPQLRLLDVLSCPVGDDEIRRFSALNPKARVLHRLNPLLQAALRGATRVEGIWRDQRERRTTRCADEGNQQQVRWLVDRLEVQESTRRIICSCLPGLSLELTVGKRKEELSIVCDDSLRWSGWPGDFTLTPSAREALQSWLTARGVALKPCGD